MSIACFHDALDGAGESKHDLVASLLIVQMKRRGQK